MTTFAVLTYNIRHGVGTDDMQNLTRIEAVLRGSKAELMGIQEVDGADSPRSNNEEQSKILAEATKTDYHYAPAFTEPFTYGNAILTKFPITKKDSFVMPKLNTQEDRSAAIVEILINGKPLTFITTHLGLSEEERLQQAEQILNYIKKLDTPVVLVGDFNASPDSPTYAKISEVLVDAGAQQKVTSPTFPALVNYREQASVRIDYIFVSSEIEIRQVELLDSQASDHFPLKAVLRI